MIDIIGVKFRTAGKIYSFATDGQQYAAGDRVIVETSRGVECGEVATPNHMEEEKNIPGQVKPIMRRASVKDLRKLETYKAKEKEAYTTCMKKIQKHKLDMKLIDVEFTFDGSKVLFYFTADGRIDFRELVKDLASVFRTRIELRQIGVRDEAKMIGGLGICGRPFCCSTFLSDFHPVSIKMAKEQGLSLNPTKISGTCGRLMCCLKYEQNVYESLLKVTPRVGAYVRIGKEKGYVVESNLLTGKLSLKMDKSPDGVLRVVHRSEVKVIKGASAKKEKEDEKVLEELKNLE